MEGLEGCLDDWGGLWLGRWGVAFCVSKRKQNEEERNPAGQVESREREIESR